MKYLKKFLTLLIPPLLLSYMASTPVDAQPQGGADGQTQEILLLELKDGTVKIRLRPDLAPKHVARIKLLVSERFYDGLLFHRVINGFMAQTGDPTGTGRGGSDYPDLRAEFSEAPFLRGVVGMARAGHPDSANSQFFICFEDSEFLNRQYTVWGEVIEGMEFVDKIMLGEPPENPDKIISLRLM